jgi:hypothetical protein
LNPTTATAQYPQLDDEKNACSAAMRGHEISLVKRAAVLTFWWFGNGDYKRPHPDDFEHRSWMEIANALHVEPTTARSLVQRAIARAREKVAQKQKLLVDAVDVDELTFDEVLMELEDAPRSGRPKSKPRGDVNLGAVFGFSGRDGSRDEGRFEGDSRTGYWGGGELLGQLDLGEEDSGEEDEEGQS